VPIQSYFGRGEKPAKHIVDYGEMLQETRNLLKRSKKGLSPLR
jgi:hypothetical protein